MMKYREFDFEKYPNVFEEGRLYELQTEQTNNISRTKPVRVTSKEIFEEAKVVPWFFVVDVSL